MPVISWEFSQINALRQRVDLGLDYILLEKSVVVPEALGHETRTVFVDFVALAYGLEGLGGKVVGARRSDGHYGCGFRSFRRIVFTIF